ncbi:MAG TPA: formylglycine-generating enzyme family protein [Bacillota bacterium]|nr:formylglycine-generating enzyme family protein [Bacillota bacterium]
MPITFPDSRNWNPTVSDHETIFIPGQSKTYTVCGVRFAMRFVPSGLTFPTDAVANTFRDDSFATIINSYWMAETAVTYRLWSTVYLWARSHGYTFANPGRPGGYTDDQGDTLKTFGSGHDNDPVTTINWRDAIVWLNALTEYYHWETGVNLGFVYRDGSGAPIRDSQNNAIICDYLTPVKYNAKGFRLPGSGEWELAARYQNGIEWTPGNHVSGDTTGYCYPAGTGRSTAFNNYVWYLGNSNVFNPDIFSTRPVGKKAPNALGLYDLCGNVWEWLFDIDRHLLRVIRGGSWFDGPDCMRLGLVSSENPSSTDCNLGFRIARTR